MTNNINPFQDNKEKEGNLLNPFDNIEPQDLFGANENNEDSSSVFDEESIDLDDSDYEDNSVDDDIDLDKSLSNLFHQMSLIKTYKEDPFDGKYYTGYLGLNPITLLKESTDVIKMLVQYNFNEDKTSYLIKDISMFCEGINYLQSQLSMEILKDTTSEDEKIKLEEKVSKYAEIQMNMRGKLKALQDTFKLKTFSYKDNSKRKNSNNQKKINGITLLKSYDEVNNIINTLIIDNISKYSQEEKDQHRRELKEYIGEILNVIELNLNMNKINTIDTNSYSREVKDYLNRIYSYTKEEEELLKELRFPIAYIRRENLEKYVVTHELEVNPEKIKVSEFMSNTIYQIYNLYNVMDNLIARRFEPNNFFS